VKSNYHPKKSGNNLADIFQELKVNIFQIDLVKFFILMNKIDF